MGWCKTNSYKIRQSKSAVHNFFLKTDIYDVSKSAEKPRVLPRRSERMTVRLVAFKKLSTKQIESRIMTLASVWIIRRAIRKSDFVKYVQPRRIPCLTCCSC